MLKLSIPCVSIKCTSTLVCVCFVLVSLNGGATENMLQALKKELRQEIAKKIKELPPVKKISESDIVKDRFLKHPVYEQSKRISIYVDRDDEISTRKIIRHICSSGRECFIPRYDKTEMTMLKLHRYEDLDNLIKNKENILQHSQTEPTEDAMKTGGLDLVVVPGRAFTETGKRMGRGKGYYDTYLSELKRISPHCKTIGLAFSCQMVEDLPMSDHDVPLDYVIHPLSTP
ncbi:hypothetical protein M8J76_002741 [Diaphorina citri]|nr:hypothetical protein M8J75_005561 [Diaphorina citri]KAI5744491.1 hypothetical protein M8J76_002741 [Diaphorina citri]